jgi:hypothetical protein
MTTPSSCTVTLTSLTSLPLPSFAASVPLRLSSRERILLTTLTQTLTVSEYTDLIDVVSRRNKSQRIVDAILEAVSIAIGLGMCGAGDTSRGTLNKEVLLAAKGDPSEASELLQEIFEVGRRNKILNPASMRSTYGKLMYLMQDSQSRTVATALEFSLHKPILMVSSFLSSIDCEDILTDADLTVAVCPVSEYDVKTGAKLSRDEISATVEAKRVVKAALIAKYSQESGCKPEEVERAIESISDAYTVVSQNVAPIKKMIGLLEDHFDPSREEKGYSLALSGGSGSMFNTSSYGYGMGRFGFGGGGGGGRSAEGPTLSHSHPQQYTFVWQTLHLWHRVHQHMHKLWVCADDDLLSTSSSYQLWNTGQGLNRVQSCPKVAKLMHRLLSETQAAAKAPWVGLSVVHLGDRDVPNALVFIDKYTQIPRILQPIVSFVENIDNFVSDPKIADYVAAQFGSERQMMMKVLVDYFKHGFDGSGDDGGSCIDGRLTSSWNWTSRIEKKRYYHAFLMSGFVGFDGEFK